MEGELFRKQFLQVVNMAQSKCTGDCLKCPYPQQMYCAAQHGHAIMTYMPAIIERLERLEKTLSGFTCQDIINPLKDNAQKDPGAENRGS